MHIGQVLIFDTGSDRVYIIQSCMFWVMFRFVRVLEMSTYPILSGLSVSFASSHDAISRKCLIDRLLPNVQRAISQPYSYSQLNS